jgi:hypothetical protein
MRQFGDELEQLHGPSGFDSPFSERQFGGVAPAERRNVSGYVNKEGEVNGRAALCLLPARQMRSSVSRSMSAKSYARSPARLGDCAASAVIDLRVWAAPLPTNIGKDRGQLPRVRRHSCPGNTLAHADP